MSGADPASSDESRAVSWNATPWWQRDRVAVVVVIVCTASLWWIRRHGPAWSMEEAMMLQAPARVSQGAMPLRDFDWFYGPLSLVVPAGTYAVFSPTLVVERAVGAAYVALLGIALHFVGRHWSFAVGLSMALVAVLIGGLSLTALPIMGAIAGLVGIVAFATSHRSPEARAWLAGAAGAWAVGLRPEFALFVVVLLALVTVLRAVRPFVWLVWLAGLAPYAWLVFGAGFGTTWRNLVTDAAQVASERHLPLHVNLGGVGLLVWLGAAVAVTALVFGGMRWREVHGVALVGLGAVGLCLLPEYIQRADTVHAIYATPVLLATIVPVAYELSGRVAWFAVRPVWRQVGAIGLAAVVLLGLRPKFVLRATLRDARSALTGGPVFAVHNGGGVWYYPSAADARDHARLVRVADRIAPRGSILFVGPVELDRPTYNDGSFYTLLPHYEQTTHFYDFHPGIATSQGTRLADDVRAATVVILCDVGFDEANASARRGSREATDVIKNSFVQVTTAGGCRLYERPSFARASGADR